MIFAKMKGNQQKFKLANNKNTEAQYYIIINEADLNKRRNFTLGK